MDPDAALARLRELSKTIDGYDGDADQDANNAMLAALAEEMAVTFDGLDNWLTKQGYLPNDWNHQR